MGENDMLMAILTDGSSTQQPAALEHSRPKSPLGLHAIRFAAIYYTSILLYWPLSAIPGVPQFGQKWMADAWLPLVRFVGAHVFGATNANLYQSSGGSDSVFDYLQNACALAIAAIGVVVWRFALPKTSSPERVYAYLRLFLRYLLATVMLEYGVMKPWQFPAPSKLELSQSFGSEVPMGLLWNFVGASRGYTIFSGAVEVVVGLLILSRRTTLLGACLGRGVTLNIFALNLFYDVPVKLFSLQLLIACLILIAPDTKRLAGLFLLDRTASPSPESKRGPNSGPPTSARRAAIVAEALYCLVLIGQTLWLPIRASARVSAEEGYDVRGLWDVVSYRAQPTPPSRWKQVTIDQVYGRWMSRVDFEDGHGLDGPAVYDGTALTLPAPHGALTWECRFPTPDHMVLTRGSMRIELKRNDQSLSLMGHHIHWIQDPAGSP